MKFQQHNHIINRYTNGDNMPTKKKQRTTPTRTARKVPAPLIIEPHPKDYKGYPFITLIMYRKQHMLTIVDNSNDETIKAFVLDYCGAESVNEENLILTAVEWYRENKNKYPISIEFSRRGMTSETARIYRSLNIEYVSRVIGPVPSFPMGVVKSIKRRRRKAVPPGVEVRYIDSPAIELNQFFQ